MPKNTSSQRNPVRILNPVERAWLAGVVDGEGSIFISRVTKEKRRDWKDKWEYKGSPSVLRGILPQILPYLLIKREVAGDDVEIP